MKASISALLGVALLLGAGCGDEPSDEERDRAIASAMEAFERVEGGEDLEQGPCIAEELPGLPDWVADIAHDPREPVDDDPANQCQRYRDGEASHFVELTPEGELIRAE